jgi:hypothetical protein
VVAPGLRPRRAAALPVEATARLGMIISLAHRIATKSPEVAALSAEIIRLAKAAQPCESAEKRED